jgi:3'(2'), 5'-bisphosphate nucleotidase
MIDVIRAAEAALSAALEASHLVMRVYATAFSVEYKSQDDPVTRADREANALLCDRLDAALPGVPRVAEESDPSTYGGFERSDAAWFIDPLDGTREFVARNGEFAVMIGLAQGGRATVGVIVAPAWRRAFVGVVGHGAWEVANDGSRAPIRVSSRSSLLGASVLVSRSRPSTRVAPLLSATGTPAVIHGSSGLKAVLVATGAHDVYVQPGPAGMRWDACASDALVEAAGGKFTEIAGHPIDYATDEIVNTEGLLATNGWLHASAVMALKSSIPG